MRTTNDLSPSRRSARDSTPLAMTWLHCSSSRGRPAKTRTSRKSRPVSEGARRSTSSAALLKRAIAKSRRKTTIGTSTASRMSIRSAVSPSTAVSSRLTARKPLPPVGRAVISGGPGSCIQLAAPLEDGVGDRREKLTQCQQHRLGSRHVEWRSVA